VREGEAACSAAHEAPPAEFAIQPSQKDGLGRMCRPHWNEYTSALRTAALARKAAEGETPAGSAPTEAAKPRGTRVKRGSKAIVPEAGAQGDAG
jgi:hypothetical protein